MTWMAGAIVAPAVVEVGWLVKTNRLGGPTVMSKALLVAPVRPDAEAVSV
ncbi:MAG: hypothetical protein HY560_00785 [Gemmatimonadetes bacterium]|nr:hypothetical protein [Gemmatimonadota bacterium]